LSLYSDGTRILCFLESDIAPAAEELKTYVPRRQSSVGYNQQGRSIIDRAAPAPQTHMPLAPKSESFGYKLAEDVYRCTLCFRHMPAPLNLSRRRMILKVEKTSVRGDEKVVKMLLDAGGDVNAHGGWCS
jgi:hypothetical protein